MNYQKKDAERIKKVKAAQKKTTTTTTSTVGNNSGNVGYSQKALAKLEGGNYGKSTNRQVTKRTSADQVSKNTSQANTQPKTETSTTSKIPKLESQNDKNYVVKRDRYNKLMSDNRLANDIKTLAEVNYKNANQDASVSQEWADEYGAKKITGGMNKSQFINTLSRRYGLTPKELNDMALTFHSDANKAEVGRYGEQLQKIGEEHPILGSVGSLVGTLGSGIEGAYNTVVGAITGDDRYLSNMFSTTKKSPREGAKQNIKSNAGKTVYDVGMGVGDMAVGAAAGSAPVILAGNTANEAVNSAIDRGSSVRKASVYGAGAGALDYITNTIGLEKAKDLAVNSIKSTGIKQFLAKNAAAGLGEAGENVIQDLGQSFLDQLLNGKNSELSRSYEDKVANGMSESDALSAVAKEYVGQLGSSAAIGFGMGSAMQAGKSAIPALSRIANRNSDIPALRANEPVVDNAIKQSQAAAGEIERLNNQLPKLGEVEARNERNIERIQDTVPGTRKEQIEQIVKETIPENNNVELRIDTVNRKGGKKGYYVAEVSENGSRNIMPGKVYKTEAEAQAALSKIQSGERTQGVGNTDVAKMNDIVRNMSEEEAAGRLLDIEQDLQNNRVAAEKAETNPTLTRKVEPLQGEAKAKAQAEVKTNKAQIKALNNEIDILKNDPKNLHRGKLKKAVSDEIKAKKAEIAELQSGNKQINRRIKGEATPVVEELGLQDNVKSIKKEIRKIGNMWAGGDAAKQVVKDINEALDDFIETGDQQKYNDLAAAIWQLHTMATNEYTSKSGNVSRYTDYYPNQDGIFKEFFTNNGFIGNVLKQAHDYHKAANAPEIVSESAPVSNVDVPHDIAQRYSQAYNDFDTYDYMDNVQEMDSFIEQMAEDIANGEDLTPYIAKLEEDIYEAPDEQTAANMQSLIDELTALQNGSDNAMSNEGAFNPEYQGVPVEYSENYVEPEMIEHTLTGQKVSPEYAAAVRKLESGQMITSEEYNAIPEIIEAKNRAGSGNTAEIDTPERKAKRQEILATINNFGSAQEVYDPVDGKTKVRYTGEVEKGHRADIIIGLPSSGKSSAVVDPISNKYKSKLLDSDEVKKLIPEFDGGWGAGLVHEESKEILAYAKANAFKNGENVVLPIVGSNADKVKREINLLREYGYEVHLHLNDLDAPKAAARNMRRFASQGRFLDLDSTSFEYGDKPRSVYEQLKKEGVADGYTKVSNDVRLGKSPVQLEGTEVIPFDWRNNGQSGRVGVPDTSTGNEQVQSGAVVPDADNTETNLIQELTEQPNTAASSMPETNTIPRLGDNNPNNPEDSISRRYETLKNSDLFQKSEANMSMLETAKEQGVFNKDIENRARTQQEALDEYINDPESAIEKNLSRQWDSGKDVDTSMLILHDALDDGSQAYTNLVLLKQAQQAKKAGRQLRAYRDYAGTKEGTIQKAGQYLNDKADSILSNKKQKADVESAAERVSNGDIAVLSQKYGMDEENVQNIVNALGEGATKNDVAKMIAMYQAVGKTGISPEALQKIKDIYDQIEAQNLNPNSRARAELEADAFKVLADDIGGKRTWKEQWDSWRYLAMLGNPKTHLRNVLGNLTHRMVTEVKDDIGAVLEGAVSKVANIDRTKALLGTDDRSLLQSTADDADNVAYTALNDMGNKYNVKSEIDRARDSFNNPLLSKIDDLNSNALDIEDYSALKRKYSRSLARFLKANGANESIFNATDDASKALLEKGRAYAIDQAKQATFHEYSRLADALTQFSKNQRQGNIGNKAVGMVVEGLVPFKKTPINILKQGVKYSPISLAKSIATMTDAVRTGNKTASDAIEDLASGLTGTGIMALGGFLAHEGLLTGGANDNYDVDNAETEQGSQNYALKIGNNSYTLDWLAPLALPLFVGAELANSIGEGVEDDKDVIDKFISSISTVAEPITEMSMLQGIQNALNELSYSPENIISTFLTNATLGYASQGIPTLAGQIARSVDDTRRSTYTDQPAGYKRQLDKAWTKIENKIPFLSMTNEPYVGSNGQTQQNEGAFTAALGNNGLTRFMDQTLSPGYFKHGEVTPTDEELNRLYEATGESVYKNVANGKIGSNPDKLSKEDFTKYQTLYGSNTDAFYNDLIASPEYEKLDDSERVNALNEAKKISKMIADYEIGGKALKDSEQKVYDIYKQQGKDGIVQYINDKTTAKSLGMKYDTYQKKKQEYSETPKTTTTKTTQIPKLNNPVKPAETVEEYAEHKNTAKDLGIQTKTYEKISSKAGANAEKVYNAIPSLKRNGLGSSSAYYTYADAIAVDPNLSTSEFVKTFNAIDADNSKGIKQDELITYFNNHNVSQDQASKMWKMYGDSEWKKIPRLEGGQYKKVAK